AGDDAADSAKPAADLHGVGAGRSAGAQSSQCVLLRASCCRSQTRNAYLQRRQSRLRHEASRYHERPVERGFLCVDASAGIRARQTLNWTLNNPARASPRSCPRLERREPRRRSRRWAVARIGKKKKPGRRTGLSFFLERALVS